MGGRLTTVIGVFLLVAAAYGLYLVKWEVRDLKRQNTMLQAEIMQQQEAIRVLETEWAYLTRPQRLQLLAKQYLELDVVHGVQMSELESLNVEASQPAVEDEGLLSGLVLSSTKGY